MKSCKAMEMNHICQKLAHDLALAGAKEWGWQALSPPPWLAIDWPDLDKMRRSLDPNHPNFHEHMRLKYEFMCNNPWFRIADPCI